MRCSICLAKNSFKDIWKSGKLDDENKKIIFVWFDHLINIMNEMNQ